MTFGFDEQFAMFDITPVENQFLLEYLPAARGDYVKVYLYGLMHCYHPRKNLDAAVIGRELDMPEEEVQNAFRYWERQGIVRRIQDHPPEWVYINIKQKDLMTETAPDPDYARFCAEVQSCFAGKRDFHGTELAACYDWKEDLHLSEEVILMVLKHMENTRGKSFRIRDAEKVAMMLSEEKAFQPEEAEIILERDEAMNSGLRRVLRKLGKKYTPSEANLKLYRKWRQEWHFTQEAIEDACDRTGTSDPSLAVVDAILERAYLNQEGRAAAAGQTLGKAALDASEQQRANLRQLLRETGRYGQATPQQQKLFEEMSALYPQEILLIAARECAARQRNFDSVLQLLKSWKERGFTTEKQILDHIASFRGKEEFLRKLKEKWAGRDTDFGQKTIQMLDRWEGEMGFSREMITLAADLAFEARKPVAYMDKTLGYWAEQNIRTPAALEEHRRLHPAESGGTGRKKGGAVSAQQYDQRDYSGEQDDAMQRMLSLNGGDGHA